MTKYSTMFDVKTQQYNVVQWADSENKMKIGDIVGYFAEKAEALEFQNDLEMFDRFELDHIAACEWD